MIFSFLLAVLTVHVLRAAVFPAEAYWHTVREMGYEDVSTLPEEVVQTKIPQKFNKVYERYNALLKTEGYDLSLYRGKTCTRYTYQIPSENARANIFVYKGKIIGGDISSITIDGIMIPIKNTEEKKAGKE